MRFKRSCATGSLTTFPSSNTHILFPPPSSDCRSWCGGVSAPHKLPLSFPLSQGRVSCTGRMMVQAVNQRGRSQRSTPGHMRRWGLADGRITGRKDKREHLCVLLTTHVCTRSRFRTLADPDVKCSKKLLFTQMFAASWITVVDQSVRERKKSSVLMRGNTCLLRSVFHCSTGGGGEAQITNAPHYLWSVIYMNTPWDVLSERRDRDNDQHLFLLSPWLTCRQSGDVIVVGHSQRNTHGSWPAKQCWRETLMGQKRACGGMPEQEIRARKAPSVHILSMKVRSYTNEHECVRFLYLE